MLLVTEKYRVAKVIAKSLGFRYFEYDHFENDFGDVICFSNGHLFTLEHHLDDIYAWDSPQNFDRLPRTLYNDYSDRDVFIRGNHIASKDLGASIIGFMQSHDTIINCCDMDREGERIFYDLFNQADTTAHVLRMDLSQGLTKRLVCEAYSNLADGIEFKARHYASQARNCSDFAYGLGTQVLTYYGRSGELHPFLGGVSDGKASVVSIGSVQLPTLSVIGKRCSLVEKHRIRRVHKPTFSIKVGRYKLEFEYDAQRSNTDESLLNQESLSRNYCRTRGVQSPRVEVVDVQTQTTKSEPQKPFSTSSLQAAMSSMSPSESMNVLQSLYLKGLISYPRTDEQSLPDKNYSNGRLSSLLESLSQNQGFSEKLEKGGISLKAMSRSLEHGSTPNCVSHNSDKYAHSALVPTDVNASRIELTDKESAVYNAICERFVNSLATESVSVQCDITVAFVEESLGVLGEKRSLFRCRRIVGANAGKLHDLEVGQTFDAMDIKVKLLDRDVPQYYSLSELPEVMRSIASEFADEKIKQLLIQANGIGTPFTRGKVIDTLIERQYIEVIVEGGIQRVVITSRGLALLSVMPEMFTSPEIKALWEKQLNAIEHASTLEQATRLRNAFIARAFDEVEQLCRLLNRKQLGAYTKAREPADAKLQKQVQDRALLLNLDFDSDIFTSKQACLHFLMANPEPYSQATMRSLESSGMDTDSTVMRDPRRIALRKQQKRSDRPPSAKQLLEAERLSQKVHLKMPESAKQTANSCNEFIIVCKTKQRPTIAQLRKLKGLAKKINFPLNNSMLKSRVEVTRLIKELSEKARK